jgi:EAL domain-containing protein (putative c-di-GMP-specific phosphodiesterase class I)
VFVKTLSDLAKKLGIQVVAEWVQTETDAKLLQSWGVDLLQGFLYGMPQRGLLHKEEERSRNVSHQPV